MRETQISKTLIAHQYATMPAKDIAEHYGICLDRLYRVLDDCGIPRKRNRRPNREIPVIVIKD